ncbi:MAG TPA: hypothetical protein VH107_14625, partial [Lacipirellulaceae bacterium]|nr:hypothetical protein [Lacipirellulaceae bacterium]
MYLLLLILSRIISPQPPIVIAHDTTYITQPLRPNGLPDYEEYLLDLDRQGVTPDNNAAVLLWRALWPHYLDPPQYDAMRTELGLNEIPANHDRLELLYSKENEKRVNDWLRKQNLNPDVVNKDDAFIDRAQRPWMSQQLPPLADWLRTSQRPIDLLVEGSRRPRFYSPSPTVLEHRGFLLLTDMLPGQANVRQMSWALEARAMWNIGEGRPDDAWKDLLAIYRWAQLTTQGHTLIEQLIAMSVAAVACESTQALLGSDQLTDKLARQIESDLANQQFFSKVADRIDHYERLEALDVVIYAKRAGLAEAAGTPRLLGFDWSKIVPIDWNAALRKVNQHYDRLVDVTKMSNRQAQKKAFRRFEAELTAEANRARAPSYICAALFSRKLRGELVGSIIARFMIQDEAEKAVEMQDRANTDIELIRLAAAITVIRAEHGNYPATFNELVPGVVRQLPVDQYNAKPFV